MNIYAVAGILNDQYDEIADRARKHYSDANVYPLPNLVFVATSGETSHELCLKLGIGDDKNNFTGVAVMAQHYWGYHEKDLWEWIAIRSRGNGVQ